MSPYPSHGSLRALAAALDLGTEVAVGVPNLTCRCFHLVTAVFLAVWQSWGVGCERAEKGLDPVQSQFLLCPAPSPKSTVSSELKSGVFTLVHASEDISCSDSPGLL